MCYLIHAVAIVAMMAASHDWSPGHTSTQALPAPFPGFGYSLPVVYRTWAMVVLALYVPCRAFGRWKTSRNDWWVSYV